LPLANAPDPEPVLVMHRLTSLINADHRETLDRHRHLRSVSERLKLT